MNLSFLICTWKQQYLPLTAVMRNNEMRQTFSVPRLPKEASLSAIVRSGALHAFQTPAPSHHRLYSPHHSAMTNLLICPSTRLRAPGGNRLYLFCSQFY